VPSPVFAAHRWESPRSSTDSIRVGDHRVHGAIFFGLLGAGAGALIGALAECSRGSGAPGGPFEVATVQSCDPHVPLYLFLGGVVGGTLGYYIGRHYPRWKTVDQ
jgi:hypothetical protein